MGVIYMIGIYIITSLRNQKVYIGQSKHIENRWEEHRTALQKNVHPNKHLQRAWNKYGEKNFIFSVLEECPENILDVREQYWIDYYGGINSQNTYNFREGGSHGTFSDETLKIMSENTKRLRQDADWVARNSQAIRDSWTPERRQQMSIAKKGTKWTEKQRENRKKFDDSRRGVSRDISVKNKISNTLKGHTVSEETRQKLREAGKRQIHPPVTEEQRKHISEGAKRGWETRRRNMQKKKSEEEVNI